jgi:hypothetical protein
MHGWEIALIAVGCAAVGGAGLFALLVRLARAELDRRFRNHPQGK